MLLIQSDFHLADVFGGLSVGKVLRTRSLMF